MDARTTLVSDVRNKTLNGSFNVWEDDDPAEWTVDGEGDSDPEASEVGSGEGHNGGGNGSCNFYTSMGMFIQIYQDIALIIGRRYKIKLKLSYFDGYGLHIADIYKMVFDNTYTAIGEYSFTFTATYNKIRLCFYVTTAGQPYDVTVDYITVKPMRPRVPI